MFEVFDLPDLKNTCERRSVSALPTEALTMLNNEFPLFRANWFAQRVFREAGTDPESQVKTMYRFAFSREPAPKELESNVAFLKKQMNPAGSGANEAALTDLAHVVLNLDEFERWGAEEGILGAGAVPDDSVRVQESLADMKKIGRREIAGHE